MHRFWLEVDLAIDEEHPAGLLIGCGVTANAYDDALALVQERVFKASPLPSLKKLIDDVDTSSLNAGHVLPNIGIPSIRGIWFPLGYE
ncbi:MAG TPA: hypothetical protein VKN18_23070 [Blastocatellia bacterium]|nr:hypothetical protein [Blastocatellia bacterium]